LRKSVDTPLGAPPAHVPRIAARSTRTATARRSVRLRGAAPQRVATVS